MNAAGPPGTAITPPHHDTQIPLVNVRSVTTMILPQIQQCRNRISGSSKLTGMRFPADYLACSPGGCGA